MSGRADGGRWVDVWLIGSEGLVGIPLILGNCDAAPFRRTVRVPGSALRLRRDILHATMDALPEFRRLLLAYVELVVNQTAQASLCNASHSISQRLSRWLLIVCDRLGSNAIPMTHQGFARLLGVHRPSITSCLSSLQEQGAVRAERGCTYVLDRSRLEQLSCGCNRAIQPRRLNHVVDGTERSAPDGSGAQPRPPMQTYFTLR